MPLCLRVANAAIRRVVSAAPASGSEPRRTRPRRTGRSPFEAHATRGHLEATVNLARRWVTSRSRPARPLMHTSVAALCSHGNGLSQRASTSFRPSQLKKWPRASMLCGSRRLTIDVREERSPRDCRARLRRRRKTPFAAEVVGGRHSRVVARAEYVCFRRNSLRNVVFHRSDTSRCVRGGPGISTLGRPWRRSSRAPAPLYPCDRAGEFLRDRQ